MKYRFMQQNSIRWPMKTMARILRLSVQAFHAWRKRVPSKLVQANQRLLAGIKRIHQDCKQRYGSPRITWKLQKMGVACNRKRVARLMRLHGIRAKTARSYRPKTTDSKHHLPVAANLLARQFNQVQANKVWLADITYVPTREGFLYLSAVMDLCSRKIVGWSIQEDLTRFGPLRALHMAVQRQRPPRGLLCHSDRGSQYASTDYQNALKNYGMTCSMSAKGSCYDNAPMESFFHTLKTELFEGVFGSKQQALNQIFQYIEVFYNRQRMHSSLGGLTPQDFEDKLQKVA